MERLAFFCALALAVGTSSCGHDVRREARAEERSAPTASVVSSVDLALALPSAPAASASAENDGVPPLRTGGPFIKLPVEGFGEAVVSVPEGATSPRPVVVAVHGNYNRPDSLCEAWRPVFGTDVFVLCPRGIERDDSPSLADQRYTYDNTKDLGTEIDRAVDALKRRFNGYVDDGAMVYAGFSIGAIMGVFVTAHEPNKFPRIALVEGGIDRYVPDVLDGFAKGGGLRVLFVCGQKQCAEDAPFTVQRLENAGVRAECIMGPPVGHRYDDAIADLLRGALPWLLEGDARYGYDRPKLPLPTRFN